MMVAGPPVDTPVVANDEKHGATPKEFVWRRGSAQVWRCVSSRVRFAQPILLVSTFTSPSAILDLRPGNSMAEFLRDAGFDVFVLDWGVPTRESAEATLSTYVDDHLPEAVEAVRAAADAREVSLAAFCVGGIPTLLYVAGHPDAPVRSLVTLATPVDLYEAPMIAVPIREARLRVDELVDDDGNVPTKAFLRGVGMVAPSREQIVSEFGADAGTIARWIKDARRIPGGLVREFADHLVCDNALASGVVDLGNRRIELANVRCPVLNVIAEEDTLFPLNAVEPLRRLVGHDTVDELRIPAGHLAFLAGRHAAQRTFPPLARWLERHSDGVGAPTA